ncbi:MAG: acylneuraminate cytidylyltransferase family protein [Desulfamplus sp.]|nr:acylneuraminate cytidylyltransferase family protein [Desulfamplus sp.]
MGLIPAKGGSTRLPRKNILMLGEKPLLLWAGDALKASGICSRIVVSTEDDEIADIAAQGGLEVPFLRPKELACDPAGVVQVALHCLELLKTRGEYYDTLVITLPTSPFRTSQDLKNAYQLFIDRKASFLLSVSRFDHAPFSAMKIENGIAMPWFPEYFGRKSQEMPNAFRPNGALHILDIPAFEETRDYLSQPLYAYEMPWPRGMDIDTAEDFAMAEALLRAGIIA